MYARKSKSAKGKGAKDDPAKYILKSLEDIDEGKTLVYPGDGVTGGRMGDGGGRELASGYRIMDEVQG